MERSEPLDPRRRVYMCHGREPYALGWNDEHVAGEESLGDDGWTCPPAIVARVAAEQAAGRAVRLYVSNPDRDLCWQDPLEGVV